MTANKIPSIDFEKTLTELEQLVAQLESGEATLEQALASFARGVELTRACQTALTAAEQRVEMLLEKNGRLEAEPFILETQDS